MKPEELQLKQKEIAASLNGCTFLDKSIIFRDMRKKLIAEGERLRKLKEEESNEIDEHIGKL